MVSNGYTVHIEILMRKEVEEKEYEKKEGRRKRRRGGKG
jgi:hypothetical protein